MGDHIVNGQFQSDKYLWSKPGFVPLKITDKMAQPVLWAYAQERRSVDAEFADDLETCLKNAGYDPTRRVQELDEQIATLTKERDEWKRRAAAHGCDTERGDPDCG